MARGSPRGLAPGARLRTVEPEVPVREASALLSLLGEEPVAIDTLVEQSRLPSGQASAELIALELRGLVRRIDGQRYIRS